MSKVNLLISLNLLINLFFYVYAGSKNFQILKKDITSKSFETIGTATFEKKILDYNEEKVVKLTVNMEYDNLGRKVSERHEAIGKNTTYEMIYTRYEDSQKTITSKKEGDKVNITFIGNNYKSTNKNKQISKNIVPSILVYFKLPSKIGIENEIQYLAYNENEFNQDKLVVRGKAVYKNIQDITIFNKQEKLHLFVNSIGSEKSIIYYDLQKEIRAIEFVYNGQTIVFLRI